MKRLPRTIAVLLLAGLAPLLFAATTNKVVILYGDSSQVNRHAVNFLYQNAMQSGQNWVFTATNNPGDIKPGQYHAVIVMSTAVSNGVEPKLLSFIQTYAAKSELILVSLLAKGEMSVAQVPAAQSSLGVDTVAAATIWEGRGRAGSAQNAPKGVTLSNFSSPIRMHDAWVQDVIKLLGR